MGGEFSSSGRSEKQGVVPSVETLIRAYDEFAGALSAGESVSEPRDDQLLSLQSLLIQATNGIMVDTAGLPTDILDEKIRIAVQAAIRFHSLQSLAIGSTPQSYELYDAIDDPSGFMTSVEEILGQKRVAVKVQFEKVSDYARHIAYNKGYNDELFSHISFSERRGLFEQAAFSLSQPYFEKLQNLTNGVA